MRLLKGENQRTRRLYEGEEEAPFAAADQLFVKHRVLEPATAKVMRARIEFAIDLGLRRGEMLKIQNKDIDWRATPDPILTIRPANAKSRRQRRIAVALPVFVRGILRPPGIVGRCVDVAGPIGVTAEIVWPANVPDQR